MTSSRDEEVTIWDSGAGTEIEKLRQVRHRPVIRLGISQDGRTAFTTIEFEQMKAYAWDVATGELIGEFSGSTYHSQLDAFVVAPAGDRVLVALSDWGYGPKKRRGMVGPRTDEIVVCEIGSRLPVRSLKGHTKTIRAVAVSGDGRVAVSGGDHRRLIVWDVASGRRIATLRGHTGPVSGIAVPVAGRTAVSTSDDGTARVWDLTKARQLAVSANPAGRIGRVAVSTDGSTAVLCSTDGSIGLWDVVAADSPVWLAGHAAMVNCLEISPNGDVLVTASQDRHLICGTCLAESRSPVSRREPRHRLRDHPLRPPRLWRGLGRRSLPPPGELALTRSTGLPDVSRSRPPQEQHRLFRRTARRGTSAACGRPDACTVVACAPAEARERPLPADVTVRKCPRYSGGRRRRRDAPCASGRHGRGSWAVERAEHDRARVRTLAACAVFAVPRRWESKSPTRRR